MNTKTLGLWGITSLALAIGSFLLGHRLGLSDTSNKSVDPMATFMSTFSALAYLEKGDARSGMLVLKDLAERSLVAAHRRGTLDLDAYRSGATNQWFSQYAALRKKLPSHPDNLLDGAFDREVESILAEAVKANSENHRN